MTPEPGTSELSLKEIAEIALDNSPAFLTAQASYKASKLQAENSFAAFFPSLDLTSSLGPQGYSPNTVPASAYSGSVFSSWTSGTALALTETLWNNGETAKQYQISKLTEEQNHLQYLKIKGQVLLTVLQSYCEWSYSLLQLGFTHQYAAELDRQFKLASAQYHQGLKTRSDYLRFQTQVQRSQLDLISAEKLVETSRITLINTIGLSQSEDSNRNRGFKVLEKPRAPSQSSSWHLDANELIENRIFSIRRQISDKEVALIKSRDVPQLFLTAGAQYGSSYYFQTGQSWNDNQQTSWNALLTLKFNFWDMGVRNRNIQIQAEQEVIAQQDIRNTLLNDQKDLLTFKEDQLQLQRRQEVTTSLVSNEQTNYRQIEQDYRQGKITYLDLTQALSEVLDAQSKKLRVDFDSLILYSKWKYFKGTLDENNLEE